MTDDADADADATPSSSSPSPSPSPTPTPNPNPSPNPTSIASPSPSPAPSPTPTARRPRSLARFWGVIPVVVVALLFLVRALLHDAPLDRLAPAPTEPKDPVGTVARAGSVYIGNGGGPVIIGFFSVQPALLIVGPNHRFIRGGGLVKERLILPPGPVAIRLAAHADDAPILMWSPVGRRGEEEYIPASSLSPAPPATATFSHPGTAILDGLVALGLLATLVATILVLARRRLALVPRTTWIAMAAIFVAAMAVRLYDLDGFGQGWDEAVNFGAGRNYITNLVGLDFRQAAWRWNYEHPPVMKYLEGIGAQFADNMDVARAFSAAWISLGAALLVPIGARLFRPRVGILAAAICALLPPMIAHGQIVGHESPSVLWWAIAALLSITAFDGDGATDRRTLILRLVGIGAVCGIAVASRFVNGLVLGLAGLIVLVQAPSKQQRWSLVKWGWAVIGVVAIATFFLVWPRLWHHPIDNLRDSLAKLDQQHALEPFLGDVTNKPGPHYFLVYLYGTSPVGVLALVAMFAWRAIAERPRRGRALAICGLLLGVPLLAAASPVKQDGVRYVMPCLTALALMAAVGADWLAVTLERKLARAFAAIAAIVVAYLLVVAARTHPYYLDYFGEQVGGAHGVASRGTFETAWWGEGIGEAVDYVNAHAAKGDPVDRDCLGMEQHLGWFRYDLWDALTQDPLKAVWLVRYGDTKCKVPPDARAVYSVTHDGEVFATVYHRP